MHPRRSAQAISLASLGTSSASTQQYDRPAGRVGSALGLTASRRAPNAERVGPPARLNGAGALCSPRHGVQRPAQEPCPRLRRRSAAVRRAGASARPLSPRPSRARSADSRQLAAGQSLTFSDLGDRRDRDEAPRARSAHAPHGNAKHGGTASALDREGPARGAAWRRQSRQRKSFGRRPKVRRR